MNIIIRKLEHTLVAFYSGDESMRLVFDNGKTLPCSRQTYKESSRLTEQDFTSTEYRNFIAQLKVRFGAITFKQTWEQLDA